MSEKSLQSNFPCLQWTGHNRDQMNEFIGLENDPENSRHGYIEKGRLIIRNDHKSECAGNVQIVEPGEWVLKTFHGFLVLINKQ